MKRRITLFLVILLLLATTTSASAQAYSFSLDREVVHVFWNSDGSVSLDYTFVFNNNPGAHVIDFVDVGMPHGNYAFNSISADMDGHALKISSDFQGDGLYGFSVDMGAYAIQPGQSGTVHVYVGRVSKMLYPDDKDEVYASAVFAPTWFGSQYVTGSTDLTVIFHLPPGIQPGEPRYHIPRGGWPGNDAPEATYDDQNQVTYTWHSSAANGYTQYTFGMSFPKQYVPEGAIVQPPAFSIDWDALIGPAICGCFALFFFGLPILGIINERKRKMQYLPPKISIEGHGIKRGLTAVEAAILMEQPLDKVMTMILFSVVKKNAAQVITREPLKLQVIQPIPEELHNYEKDFLLAFSDVNKIPKQGLQEMTVKLVKTVSEKMKGFSRKESIAYYKSIMERAWQQIEAAGTPEVKSQMYEQAMEWTMLDKDYDDHTRRVFSGPVYVPMWWGRYDPAYQPASVGAPKTASVMPSSSPGRAISVPGSTFAASVVTGAQSFSSRVIGDLNSFTSKVTQQTNPVPKSSSSSGGGSSSGGRSCACACACAGCACACAGGGR
ncbi:MAG: hypothetical protein QMD04_11735 [Anaerolineales bacterium]|nr:hypothetical protein [Anaerolineales bacterium]